MTLISHSRKFAFVHIYKAGGTSISDFLLPYARMRERVAVDRVGRKLFYATNILQEVLSRDPVPKGTSSWYMGVHKHAPLSEIVSYLGRSHSSYKIFSVFRDPIAWVESQYNYISIRPLHALHQSVSEISFADFVEDYIATGGLQSNMIKGARSRFNDESDTRYLDALFALEGLNRNAEFLACYLDLPVNEVSALKVLNSSKKKGLAEELSGGLLERLKDYLEPDIRLYAKLVHAGGALMRDNSGIPGSSPLEIH